MSTKRKSPPESQQFHLVIPLRPDLDRFKPANGKIFDSLPTPPYDSDNMDEPMILPTREAKKEPESPKSCSSKKSKSNHPAPGPMVESKPKKISSPTSSKPSTLPRLPGKKRGRPSRDQSPDPDDDEDIGDIALSDYSEPETKLRERETTEQRKKFAKLRKARKMISKKKALSKEIHSKRIVPDSDGETARDAGANGPSDDDSDEEDKDSEDEDESGSERTEDASETDDAKFIVNDMPTAAEAKRVKRAIDHHMPLQFRTDKLDNLSHFKIACNYLLHHIILPQISWRRDTDEFDKSCKHLDDMFHSQAVICLETSAWTVEFRRELNKRPHITSSYYGRDSKGCGACHNQTKFSKNLLKLSGKPYVPFTLNPEKQRKDSDDPNSYSDYDSEDDGGSCSGSEEKDKQHKFKLQLIHITPKCTTVISGENCAERAVEYHLFKHWKFHLIKRLKGLIKPLREKQSPKRVYQHFHAVPNPDRLKSIKREIREIFQTLDDPEKSDFGKSSIEQLYHEFTSRLNKAKKRFGTGG